MRSGERGEVVCLRGGLDRELGEFVFDEGLGPVADIVADAGEDGAGLLGLFGVLVGVEGEVGAIGVVEAVVKGAFGVWEDGAGLFGAVADGDGDVEGLVLVEADVVGGVC